MLRKNFLHSPEKAFFDFQETELFYIFFKKFFLHFGKGIFRTRSIFRNVVYLQLKAYLEDFQTSTMGKFAKIAEKIKKITGNCLYSLKRKIFLYFRKRKPRKNFLIFQETELSSTKR